MNRVLAVVLGAAVTRAAVPERTAQTIFDWLIRRHKYDVINSARYLLIVAIKLLRVVSLFSIVWRMVRDCSSIPHCVNHVKSKYKN